MMMMMIFSLLNDAFRSPDSRSSKRMMSFVNDELKGAKGSGRGLI
jgi:hypothetical protein